MSGETVTTVTVLTPPGRGAVATVSVEGPRACELVDHCFTAASRKKLAELPLRRIAFGCWHSGEELVVCRLHENRVEVHCHGGQAAVEAVTSSLVATGAVRQSAAEWVEINEPNRIRAEARLALGEALTERAALILLDQYQGALERDLDTLARRASEGSAPSYLERLLSRSKIGLHLTRPFRVVLAGAPNVGKSSLMNALVGYGRSIVFDQPGTTRDVVTATTAFDGWPVELADTAGLRESADGIERIGVSLSREQIAAADLVVLVHDATNDDDVVSEPPRVIAQRLLLVVNKIDLHQPKDIKSAVPVSAVTGEGIERLMNAIAQRLVSDPPQRGEGVPFTQRQIDLLAEAAEALRRGETDRAVERLNAVRQ